MDISSLITSLLSFLGSWLIVVGLIALVGALGVLAFNLLVIQKFFSDIWKALQELFDILWIKKWDSSKTLIWLSVFSWVVCLFVGPIAQAIISLCGWVFLIPGVHWAMCEEKKLKELLTIGGVFIAPWITGALFCYFLFASPEHLPLIAFVLWPPLSAVIAGLPKFIASDDVYKTPKWKIPAVGDRHYLVNLMLINLVLSCWIQLCFSTQTWLAEYPSLLAEDMANSSFVVKTQSSTDFNSRGVDVLNRAEASLKQSLEGQSWSQVERWLLELDQQVAVLQGNVLAQLPKAAENAYWQVKGQILDGEYRLKLFSIWDGPSADSQGYYLTKTCQIDRVAPADVARASTLINPASVPQVGNAKVQCGPAEGPIRGQPDLQRRPGGIQ